MSAPSETGPSRRSFLQHAMTAALIPALVPQGLADTLAQLKKHQAQNPADLITDEAYWAIIRQAYIVDPDLLNLNNGGVSPQPVQVQQAEATYVRQANRAPAHCLYKELDLERPKIKERLAELAGVTAGELAFTRNTTESLATVFYGIDWKKGDEVVLSKQDYPSMINQLKLLERRRGIVLRWADHQLPSEDAEALTKAYTSLFGPRTRAVLVTQMINWTGQLLPARQICAEARKRGILSIVDAAHVFGQINWDTPGQLDCDYWGTSLHKWLCAPFGTGLLYVRQEHIAGLWPLWPGEKPDDDKIVKFEWPGTHDLPAIAAVADAIDFHMAIGPDLKEARLRYLKDHWTGKARQIPGISILTSAKKEYSCALAIFSMAGQEPEKLANRLLEDFGIYTVAINWEQIHGVRITPHVYTSLADLDRFVEALRTIAG